MSNRITIIDNLWAIAESGDCRDIENLLRYHPKGYIFAPSYKNRRWDGFVSLVSHRKVKPIEMINYEPQNDYCAVYIPAGLVPFVKHQPWAQTYAVDDMRMEPPEYMNFGPRDPALPWDDDQEEAVDSAIQLKHGLVKYPTGTGKGRIIGETVRRLNRRALVLVDKVDLLSQLGGQIQKAVNCPVKAIGGGYLRGVYNTDDNVCIATYQTIASWLDGPNKTEVLSWLSTYDAVLVDEAHHVEAATYQQVLQAIPAYFRIGYSATPFKAWTPGSKSELGTYLRVQAWLGPLAAEMSLTEGVGTGRIVPADIYIIHGCTPEGDGKAWTGGLRRPMNYTEELETTIINNFRRNTIICRLAERWVESGPTIILVERLGHGFALEGRLNWPFVHGNTEERDKLYDDFRAGRVKGLIISKIGDEALDLPNVTRVILAGGGKAPHRQTQRIGRGMRASSGKTEVMVADFEDYGQYTSSHYRRRLRQYESEPAYTVVHVEANELWAGVEGLRDKSSPRWPDLNR